MNRIKHILFLSLIVTIFSCSNSGEEEKAKTHFSINVINSFDLAIPSGSGITGYKGGFLTVGDDTPWLYYLDSIGNLVDSLRLSMVEGYVPGVRMHPATKPDFECLTRLNENTVLIMGSGSYNSGRDTAYLVNAYEKQILVKKSIGPIFQQFADQAGIEDVHSLNIEGVAVANHEIYFFNRADLSKRHLIFKTDLAAFISYFTDVDTIPISGMYEPIPYNEEYGESTFSSCVYISQANLFIFTSTMEDGSRLDSLGRVVDGDIKGSFIGRIRMNELENEIVEATPIMENGVIAPIKIEGIWMHKVLSDSVVNLIGVSDPDNGTTNAYLIEVRINRLK